MKIVLALLISGSIASSASAAGTEMHEMASEHASPQQQSTSQPMIPGTLARDRNFDGGAGGLGRW